MIALALGACTTQRQATSYVNDDVYNDVPKKAPVAHAPAQAGNDGAQVVTSPDKVLGQLPASAAGEDVNDYSYSDRIKRFSNNDTTKGYFDDSFGNGSSPVDRDNSPDLNFYLGNGGYFGPSWSIGWGYPYSSWWDYRMGWGYPYYYHGYYSWYNPWYSSWYDPWYYNRWNDPYYCCGCYYTSNQEPWNNFQNSGYYYGSRRSLFRSDGGGNTVSRIAGTSSDDPRLRTVRTGPSRTSVSSSAVRSVPGDQEKYRYSRPSGIRQANFTRSAPESGRSSITQSTVRQPAPRYTRPGSVNTRTPQGTTQSYTSPVYRQPKSSQEYLAPRSQSPGTTRQDVRSTETRTGSGISNPSRNGNNRSYPAPPRSSDNYSTPRSGGSNSYSAPSRSTQRESYTPPARSNESRSYTTPSNSGNSSYTAPSRSSGTSSSPSNNNNSSGSSGRRR